MSFRETILKELKKRDWSAYKLGQESGLPIRTVQAYLAGRLDTSGERLAAMCDALELELKVKKTSR